MEWVFRELSSADRQMVREALTRKGMSQTALANALTMRVDSLSHVLAGRKRAPRDFLKRAGEVLGVRFSEPEKVA